MLKECPHCDAPLRPGEAYLGWCGECGANLFRKPDQSLPPRRADEPPPVPGEWRWVARGLLLKLVALIGGGVGAVAIAAAANWDWRAALVAPPPWAVSTLGAAVLLDIAGRLMCLGTPQASARWLVVVSVLSQFGAVVCGVGYGVAAPAAEGRMGLLVSAVLGQVGAAATFTLYLSAVGVYFRSPPVMAMARILQVVMGGAYGVLGVFLGLLVLAGLLFLVGLAMLFACPCAGCLMMAWAVKFIESLAVPFGYSLAVALVAVQVAYAVTLAALLRELWRRRLLGR